MSTRSAWSLNTPAAIQSRSSARKLEAVLMLCVDLVAQGGEARAQAFAFVASCDPVPREVDVFGARELFGSVCLVLSEREQKAARVVVSLFVCDGGVCERERQSTGRALQLDEVRLW